MRGINWNGCMCALLAAFFMTGCVVQARTGGNRTGDGHIRQLAYQPQTAEKEVFGYCGNTQTTVYIEGKGSTFMFGNSITLTDLLNNLDYSKDEVCDCDPEYYADTEFGVGYEINLTQGFVRNEEGQASLTAEQVEEILQIILWVRNGMPDF